MMVSFGAKSPITQGDCPAGGDYNAWCDCMWPAGDANNAKCKSMPLSIATPAPWTIVGASVRGIPHVSGLAPDVSGLLPGGSTGGSDTPPPKATTEEPGIFGIPTTVAVVGALVLVGGVAAFVLTKPKPRRTSLGRFTRTRRTRRS